VAYDLDQPDHREVAYMPEESGLLPEDVLAAETENLEAGEAGPEVA